MKNRYRLFLRRKSVYYAFDDTTKTFTSLKTKDKAQAERLLLAMNEAGKQPAMNLGLARVTRREKRHPRHDDTHQFDQLAKILRRCITPAHANRLSHAPDQADPPENFPSDFRIVPAS
jgi:hypothetical protein